MCDCEDRPCCGHLAESGYYSSDEAPDYEELREMSEGYQLQWESYLDRPCSICKKYFDENEDDEDDIVQGFHADCAE